MKFNWPFGNITYAKKTASSSSDADSTCMAWHDGFGLRAEVRFGMLCQGSVKVPSPHACLGWWAWEEIVGTVQVLLVETTYRNVIWCGIGGGS